MPHAGNDGMDSFHPELKLKKKDFKRLFDPTRELDGWERYRALIDASDEAYDLIDISNREARFALIVMGALNAMPQMRSPRVIEEMMSVLVSSSRGIAFNAPMTINANRASRLLMSIRS